jgi:trehalose 6-phosphate phosphatase
MPRFPAGMPGCRRHGSPGKSAQNRASLDPFCSPRHAQQFSVLLVAIIEYCSTIVFAPNLDRNYDVQAEPIDYRKTAILLDIDGTLLDLAPTPHDVRVPSTLRKTLERLHECTGGAIALVSGRSLADIDLIFKPLKLTAVGGHGAEIRHDANGSAERNAGVPLDDELKQRLAYIARLDPEIIIEDKDYSLAIHYRLAPDKKRAIEDAVDRIIADLPPYSVEVLPGKGVREIKKVGFNKGTAIRELMAHPPFAGRRPVFVGDDTTDETAFAVMPEFGGLAISVGRMVPGVAKRFETPSDVRRWLERLAKSNGA